MKKSFALIFGIAFAASSLMISCGSTSSVAAVKESSETENAPEFVRKELPENMRVGAKGDRKVKTETDPYIVSVIDEAKEKFIQSFFTDGEKQITLEYSLFIPENLDYSKKYPLVMYIPDASGASKNAKELVEQYFGADIWASKEVQEKHECFVFVPAFSEIVADDNCDVSDEIEVAMKIISSLVQNYNIDTGRIYASGQSMGCMTSLYLNSKYPNLFAASLFVSGQWWVYSLSPLKNARFFYITAEGDEKAAGGQSDLMNYFDKRNVSYSFGKWSAQETSEVQNENAKKLISEGKNANFIRFEKGTVLTDDEKMEHMASFNYGYRIEAVRDWLFDQKSENSFFEKLINAK